jgi:hypothetical protein
VHEATHAGAVEANALSVHAQRCVVISQPMLFPWVGMLEQARLADVWVHYDDVAFSKGSFINRVQLKTSQGTEWLTIPITGLQLGQAIRDVKVNEVTGFRRKHLQAIAHAFARAPYRDAALSVAERAYGTQSAFLMDLLLAGLDALWAAFSLRPAEVHASSALQVPGAGSPRVLAVVQKFAGNVYVTGHGARNYLEHEVFEAAGVDVRYMNYEKRSYAQLFGEFTPYVTGLDLLANMGPEAGKQHIASGTLAWRDFVQS